ncbi:TetR/AcrR family transcriptional regulator [Sphingobium sufflavum]|uniref:TetR/AcrR family transcriptional regulator n=1 Tax=Sphingobium sufflavum TaxID=1129547 RepID=UPI001F37A8CF|nr:TetR/AcrR family transcriptional regulator [Sphingobium sufflavum]MCE7795568.1 TetR/AcrR family transcriptional regulator [Sphingobium sufflavum]
MSTPLDARMQRSRRTLRDALLAVLEEKPFDQITVREITARAKVGYATFFRHYASKEALLHDLAAGEIGDLLDMAVPVLFVANSLESCRAMCAYVYERRVLWTALLTGGAAGTVRDEFIRQARIVTARAPTRSNGLPGDLSTVWATGGCIDVLAWWLAQRTPYSVEQVAEIVDRLIVGPIVADSRPKDESARRPLPEKHAATIRMN